MRHAASWYILHDPKEGGGVGGGGKPDDKTPPAGPSADDVAAKVLERLTPALPTLIEAAVAKLKPAENQKPDEKKKTTDDDRIATLEATWSAELKKRDEALAQEKSVNALRQALSKVDWFDLADAERALRDDLVVKTDGSVVIRRKTVTAGVEHPKDMSLEDAVKELREQKKHWVKANLKGGTGATGANQGEGFTFDSDPTYDELMRPENAAMLAEFTEKHPDRAKRVLSDGLVGLRKGK
ncbi:MAG: hypothetical protein HS116_18430 [Planctomycetes bacterium]|nr:hypothetical protein [Planctomycetota bacterium]